MTRTTLHVLMRAVTLASAFIMLFPVVAGASTPVADGTVAITFNKSVETAKRKELLKDENLTKVFSIRSATVYSTHRKNTASLVKRLRKHPSVRTADQNYLIRNFAYPNDSQFRRQWALNEMLSSHSVSIQGMWRMFAGTGSTIVAVIDGGLDVSHPDLLGRLWTNPADPIDGLDNDRNGIVDDIHGANFEDHRPGMWSNNLHDDTGHGTHVAGIIGANGNNSIGVAGINWNAMIMPLKFQNRLGLGTINAAAEAIKYAVDHGARVINASWGTAAPSSILSEAVGYAEQKGVLVVAAAGNNGVSIERSPEYPAALDNANVITVSATSNNGSLSSFSSFSKTNADLAAPGDEIYSTFPSGSGYAYYSGTSMAAPHVSGALAMYLDTYPDATPSQAKAALLASVTKSRKLSPFVSSGGTLNLSRFLRTRPGGYPPPKVTLRAPRGLRKARKKRVILFRWSVPGKKKVSSYRLYIDGRIKRVLHDPGIKSRTTNVKTVLKRGRHSAYVRGIDVNGEVVAITEHPILFRVR